MPLTTLAAWLHDLDPFAVQFPASWPMPGLRWYGLSYLLGFFLGYLLVARVARVGAPATPTPLAPQRVGDYIVSVAIGIVVGGRLGYCLLYQPALFATFYDHLPFWGPLAINEGGMASHGGILGGVLGAWWFAHRNRHDLPYLLDLFAFGAPLGLFFGRLANFVNGELFGRPAPADAWYAVKFPQEIGDWSLAQLATLGPAVQTLGLPAREWAAALAAYDFDPEARRLVGRTIARVIETTQAAGPTADALKAALDPLLTPRHPSQLYAAAAEGLVVFAVLLVAWARPRTPGAIGSWFCLTYGVMRIVDEFFRRPDQHIAHQEFAALGVTRGQWLSVLVVAVGLWGLWFSRHRARKHAIPPMGSWRRGPWTTPAAAPTPASGSTSNEG